MTTTITAASAAAAAIATATNFYLHDSEQQRESAVYIELRETNIVPFFPECVLMTFVISVCDCVTDIVKRDLCEQCNIIGTGTTGGRDRILVSDKEGYFCYDCGNIDVSFYLKNKRIHIKLSCS
jgi:hypothetical protein